MTDDGGRYRERAAIIGGRNRKRVAAMSAAVTGSGRYRKPLPEAAVTGGHYRKRAAAMAAAVT
jgi:hypothetical protein